MIGTVKAAELLGVTDRWVRELIYEGRIPGAHKVGGSWLIPTVNGYPQIKKASRGPKPTWKRVKTPPKNVININRQLIGTLMDDGNYAPPISVKCRNENTYTDRIYIPGPCHLIYDWENPQQDCGATAWIETVHEPLFENGCTFKEIKAKHPKPVKRKTESKKTSGKGFGKKANEIPVAA
jgi:excisionase family DNA binding protein